MFLQKVHAHILTGAQAVHVTRKGTERVKEFSSKVPGSMSSRLS